MKHEWRKQEKNLYIPKKTPEIITVPKQKFFTIKGEGNPNNKEFSEKVEVLYALSYAIKMMPQKGYTPEGYYKYTVYPLEGIWDLTEEGKKSDILNKDMLSYTIMIRQPDFVTKEIAVKAIESVRKKKPHPLLDEVLFDTIDDGLSVQMLHIGSYDGEPISFKRMNIYIEENNLDKVTAAHREIYLTDARKVEPSKLKTVLRYMVKRRL